MNDPLVGSYPNPPPLLKNSEVVVFISKRKKEPVTKAPAPIVWITGNKCFLHRVTLLVCYFVLVCYGTQNYG